MYLFTYKEKKLSKFSRDPFSQLLTILNKIPWTKGCQEFLVCSLKHNLSSAGLKAMKNWQEHCR